MLNGRLLAADAVLVSPLSDGFMFGCGVFETIRVASGRPLFFAAHCARLDHGTRELGFGRDVVVPSRLLAHCTELITTGRFTEGVLKIVVFADAAGPSELLTLRELPYTAAHYARGFSLRTAQTDTRAHGLGGLKTLNYLANLRARRAASAAGFDDALFVDPIGRVLETSTANIFAVRSGRVLTPPLACGILPGIVRALLLGTSDRSMVDETDISAEFLREADEVFVTNSLLGVMPVARINERKYDLGANSVTQQLAATYQRLVHADFPASR
jgi:branched-subunit amino acid aminotransferase/4-amino-4-deoxychorismate lyase